MTELIVEPLEASADRQVYVRPVLTTLGDVRDLTLGGSPGSGDSAGASTEFSPGP